MWNASNGAGPVIISGAVLAAAGIAMVLRPKWFDQINWKMRWMVPDTVERAFVTRMIGQMLSFAGIAIAIVGLVLTLK